ncbi:MAG: hypothetical protein ACRET3_02680, partial [Burkholderiales bacterium]
AQVDDNLNDGVLTDAELAAITPPVIPGFTIDSFKATKLGGITTETITDGPFAGLYSLTQRMEIFARAKDGGGHRAAVAISVKAQAIPLFQFGVFFEKGLEIFNSPPMTFGGRVHTNGNLWLSSDNAWYDEIITTPNKVFHDKSYGHAVLNGVYIDDASATPNLLDFDSRTKPNPNDFRAASNAKFDNRLMTDAYQVDSLKLPLPLGMDPIELLMPRRFTDPPELQEAKFSWRADWYIEVELNQISVTGKNLCPKTLESRSVGKVVPSNADCKKIFSFTWDAFFDGREKRFVDVFEIDVAELRNWVGASVSRRTEVLYVTFIGTPPAGMDVKGDGFMYVVRLKNGSTLPNALTVATDRPLYTQGDYNTNTWAPAALGSDAITWLSNAWNDSQHQCGNPYRPDLATPPLICPGYTIPTASNTTVNAAVVAGHNPTPCDHEDAGCPGGNYGGGLENFPRHLEWWTGVLMTYRGSLISLHWSRIATGAWIHAAFYKPPDRDWQFDTRFRDPLNLPPATPVVGSVIHMGFRPVY